jgi:hypothetical protein
LHEPEIDIKERQSNALNILIRWTIGKTNDECCVLYGGTTGIAITEKENFTKLKIESKTAY